MHWNVIWQLFRFIPLCYIKVLCIFNLEWKIKEWYLTGYQSFFPCFHPQTAGPTNAFSSWVKHFFDKKKVGFRPKWASIFLFYQQREKFWLSHSKWGEKFLQPVAKHAQPQLLKSHPVTVHFPLHGTAGDLSPFCLCFQLTKNLRTILVLEDKISSVKRWNILAQIQNDIDTVSYFLSACSLVRVSGLWTGAHTVPCVAMQLSGWGRVLYLDINSRVYNVLITFVT